MTFEEPRPTFGDIFHSSGNGLRDITYGGIASWIEDHLLDWYYQYVTVLGNVPPNSKLTGGTFHQQLGALAAAIMRTEGFTPQFEKFANGRRVDLISDDERWIIECGDTNASPIITHLFRTCERFSVLPFQSYPDHNATVCLYTFVRGANWDDDTAWLISSGWDRLKGFKGLSRDLTWQGADPDETK